jgi:hypothetical protein
MNKERPTELNKKIKRLRESRDSLKCNNREKNLLNQKLRDGKAVVAASRDRWKRCSKELRKENNLQKAEFEKQLAGAQEEVLRERMRADREQARAEQLQCEITSIREKKSGARTSHSKNGRESASTLVSHSDDHHVRQAYFTGSPLI